MSARIAPAAPPFPDDIAQALERIMPAGMEPLVLFTTLARDPRLFGKFFGAGLLDRGHLTLRQREIVIDRTTALCRSEYEWGVHVALFAQRVGLSEAQTASLANG
ncbi:MAG TPA: carboxymuconolactone decarboxylase family protein, partial [Pseudomonadales bacterium]|nr:carboxymuconolactone decarboxylase family protein [Pseudomonadales bacterium]